MNSFSDSTLDDDESGRLFADRSRRMERAPSSPLQCGACQSERISGSCRDDRVSVGETPDKANEEAVVKMGSQPLAGLGCGHSRERIGGQQTHLYRETNDFIACSQSELFGDSRTVRLDRFHAHQDLLRDVLTAVALRDEFEHLPLSFAEYLQGTRCAVCLSGSFEHVLNEHFGETWVHEDTASMHRADGGQQLRVDGALQDVAGRPRGEYGA